MGRGPGNHVLLENPLATWIKEDRLSQGPHSQQGLTLGWCPCPEPVFREVGWFWLLESCGRGAPNSQVQRFCFFLGFNCLAREMGL